MTGCELCDIQIPHYKKEMDVTLKDSDGEYKHEVLFGVVGRHRFYATDGDYKVLINENNQIIQFVKLNFCPECGRKLNDKCRQV